MKLMNLAAMALAGSLSAGAWANENLAVDALNEEQLSQELPYLEALMSGEALDFGIQEENLDLYARGDRDRRRDRDRDDRWRDRDRRRDRDRDDRWRRRRPVPLYKACYARNIRSGVVYRAVGWGSSYALQSAALNACYRDTRFDRRCRPLGCRTFRR